METATDPQQSQATQQQPGAKIDFSAIGGKPVASAGGSAVDFSAIGGKKVDAGAPANPYPIDESSKGFVAQTAQTASGILKLPKHVVDAFTQEPQDAAEGLVHDVGLPVGPGQVLKGKT